MNVKLICTDIDGTLYGDGHVPEKNLRALRACAARGIRVALVSGRNHGFLCRLSREMGVPCAIASANGSRIEASPDGPCVQECTFDTENGQRLFDSLYALNVNFEVYTREGSFVVRAEKMPDRHREGLQRNVMHKDAEVIFDEERARQDAATRAYKFVVFSESEEEITRVRKALDAAGVEHCSSASRNVEVVPEGAGKGNAVRAIAKYFGIDTADVMAFGDYTNDLPMLRAAGHPVAMANGVQELKEIAEIVAPANRDGGLGEVLFRYVLEENG